MKGNHHIGTRALHSRTSSLGDLSAHTDPVDFTAPCSFNILDTRKCNRAVCIQHLPTADALASHTIKMEELQAADVKLSQAGKVVADHHYSSDEGNSLSPSSGTPAPQSLQCHVDPLSTQGDPTGDSSKNEETHCVKKVSVSKSSLDLVAFDSDNTSTSSSDDESESGSVTATATSTTKSHMSTRRIFTAFSTSLGRIFTRTSSQRRPVAETENDEGACCSFELPSPVPLQSLTFRTDLSKETQLLALKEYRAEQQDSWVKAQDNALALGGGSTKKWSKRQKSAALCYVVAEAHRYQAAQKLKKQRDTSPATITSQSCVATPARRVSQVDLASPHTARLLLNDIIMLVGEADDGVDRYEHVRLQLIALALWD